MVTTTDKPDVTIQTPASLKMLGMKDILIGIVKDAKQKSDASNVLTVGFTGFMIMTPSVNKPEIKEAAAFIAKKLTTFCNETLPNNGITFRSLDGQVTFHSKNRADLGNHLTALVSELEKAEPRYFQDDLTVDQVSGLQLLAGKAIGMPK